MRVPQRLTRCGMLALLVAGGLGWGCTSGAVHTTLGQDKEVPSVPRPDANVPGGGNPDNAPTDDGLAPADASTPDPDAGSGTPDDATPTGPILPDGSGNPNGVTPDPGTPADSNHTPAGPGPGAPGGTDPNGRGGSTPDGPRRPGGSGETGSGHSGGSGSDDGTGNSQGGGQPGDANGSQPGDANGGQPGDANGGQPGDANGGQSGGQPGDANGQTGAGNSNQTPPAEGGAGNGNGPLPPPPPTPLSPRQACHQAWLTGGYDTAHGDPFMMAAAEDANWQVTFRAAGMDVEARPSEFTTVSTAAAGDPNGTCQVPTAWYLEILTPDVAFDPFLQTYQRVEPIRRQLATGGVAMEEKSFSSWQDFSDRIFWLTWKLNALNPATEQLQAVARGLGQPQQQAASWYTAVAAVEDTVRPGLAVAVSADANAALAPFWGILSDSMRAAGGSADNPKGFLAVAPASVSHSFARATAVANVFTWDSLVTWDIATQQAMNCDVDAETFERRCDQVFPAYASRLYRATLDQNASMFVHLVWETHAKQEAFVTTVEIQPGGTLTVLQTQRFEAAGLNIPSLSALHALESP